jgi:transcription antitermination factor NusG
MASAPWESPTETQCRLEHAVAFHDSRRIDPISSEDSAWWALHTLYHHEKIVAEMLTAKGLEVFLPVYNSLRRWRDRRVTLSLPLFPCYMFVRGGPHLRFQIVTTPGVHSILSHTDRPATIPEAEIQAIRRTVEGAFRVEPHPFLRCGERVRVKRGSLEGLTGILVRKKNLCRLVLSVEMLAQSVCVEIDASDVEPATSSWSGAGFPLTHLREQGNRSIMPSALQ